MAELTTIARPYAKAAFEFAREEKSLDAWSTALGTLAAVSEDEKVGALLASPKLTSEQKANVVTDLCGDSLSEKAKHFVALLAENKRLDLLAPIFELYENLKAQQQQFSDVKIASAFALDSEVEKTLTTKLSSTLNSDVSLTTQVDESLIGGVVIRAGDTVIDSSVKGRLAKLAESLAV